MAQGASALIFVVFLLPLGLYLLVLAHINRQPRPVFVAGTWDFVGVLFAASGFLLFGGPAILTSLNEHWRMFWLVGEGVNRDALTAQWHFWLSLSLLYFALVVGGSAMAFLQQRRLTSIYNTDADTVGGTLEVICEQFGLEPIRSGDVFVFGLSLEPPPAASAPPTGIQAPHALARLEPRRTLPARAPAAASPGEELAGQSAVLEIEAFAALHHVTLRWDPGDSPLRGVLERELERRLGQIGAAYHETGLWLAMAGYAVLCLSLFSGFLVFLRAILVL
jgi:hypothetical protein